MKLLAGGILALLTFTAQAQNQIRLFASDHAVGGESSVWGTFFELPRSFQLSGDAVIELRYQQSPTLLPERGSMTVILNGQPIDSQRLPRPGSTVAWTVTIPREYFKAGFNELQVATRKRSLDGECVDEENPGNWVRFLSSSKLVIPGSTGGLKLDSYPYPFLNWLRPSVEVAPLVVSEDPVSLSGALTIASQWGARIDRPLRMKLTRRDDAKPTVHVGISSQLSSPIKIQDGDLWITGADEAALTRALRTLGERELASQLSGESATPPDRLEPTRASLTKVGAVSLAQLGLPKIDLKGVGRNSTTIALRRPVGADLGRGGFVKLRFRHAANLNPSRSLLTVLMNSEPIGSIELDRTNADAGEATFAIPVSIANQNGWTIEIVAFHDVDSRDCSRSYEDVAWTTILGTSEVELREGSLRSVPYLDGFPYLRGRDGRMPSKPSMVLAAQPSPEMLDLAATMAALAAQSNREWSEWEVTMGAPNGAASIIIAGPNDNSSIERIKDKLLVWPVEDGSFEIKRDLRILPSLLTGAAIMQAVVDSSGVTYVVIGDDKALSRLGWLLTNPEMRDQIKGQVAVLTADHRLLTFETRKPDESRAAEQQEMQRYKPEMSWIMGAIVLVILLFVIWLGSRFVKRRAPAA